MNKKMVVDPRILEESTFIGKKSFDSAQYYEIYSNSCYSLW